MFASGAGTEVVPLNVMAEEVEETLTLMVICEALSPLIPNDEFVSPVGRSVAEKTPDPFAVVIFPEEIENVCSEGDPVPESGNDDNNAVPVTEIVGELCDGVTVNPIEVIDSDIDDVAEPDKYQPFGTGASNCTTAGEPSRANVARAVVIVDGNTPVANESGICVTPNPTN